MFLKLYSLYLIYWQQYLRISKKNNKSSRWYRYREVYDTIKVKQSSKLTMIKTNVKVKKHNNEKFLNLPESMYQGILQPFLSHFFFLFRKCTWNMLRPSNDNHQLPVSQVTQCSEGFDVTVRDSRVRHGIDLLRFGHQQM